MENLLRSKEYWSLIETGVVTAPANATAEQQRIANESKLKDLKVKNYLFQAIDRSILETILVRDTARDIWEAMRRKYQGSTKVKRAQLQALRREFEVLCMGENETVNEYFGRTLAIANRMSSHGERLEQVSVVEKILRSMPSKFNYVVCSIEESNDVTLLSIDELQSSLIVHEQRMKSQKESSDEQALKISNGGRGSGRGGGRNSNRGRGRGRQGKEFVNKEYIECYKCHKLGHYQSECPDWGESAKYAELNKEEETFLMVRNQGDCDNKEEVWFLDSGCSNHMVGNKNWLYNCDENYRDSVKLGDDSRMNVMGKGNLKLNINGRTHNVSNVYYIPGLKTNLLSIGQLQQNDVTVIFKNDDCKVFHEEKGLLFTSHMSANRMYMIRAAVITPRYLQVTKEECTHLWHNRYGHLSIKGLNTLVKKQMVKGLPDLEDISEKCSDCLVGKQHRDVIPKQAMWRATMKLELIHSDICGPINPKSNAGSRYFITFTDDFSRKTWVYFLQEKSNAFETFKKFKALVEKESSCLIQCLRTDRGGEFTSNEFNAYCSKHGIKRQLTAAYTPQQNGVSERKNRTLMNMVRCMIAGRNVPKEFWPEAVKWANYVVNRSPTLSVKDITPEEAWSGVKPSVNHFRVFGCLAYIHVPDNQRKKLDDRSVRCMLLGISEESKAYKLYDPDKKKIIVSRDVVFDEDKSWNWSKSDQEQLNDVPHIDVDEVSEMEFPQPPTEDAHVNSEADNSSEGDEQENTTNEEDQSANLPPRNRRIPNHLNDFVLGDETEAQDEMHNLAVYNSCEDPSTYDEAVKSEVWREAMDSEIESIEKNNT
jgi:transposase InsO family protein